MYFQDGRLQIVGYGQGGGEMVGSCDALNSCCPGYSCVRIIIRVLIEHYQDLSRGVFFLLRLHVELSRSLSDARLWCGQSEPLYTSNRSIRRSERETLHPTWRSSREGNVDCFVLSAQNKMNTIRIEEQVLENGSRVSLLL